MTTIDKLSAETYNSGNLTVEGDDTRMDFSKASLNELIAEGGYDCACGRHHSVDLKYLKIGSGVVRFIPDALKALGAKKPFIVMDQNTEKAAWGFVQPVLHEANIEYVRYVLPYLPVEPDECAVGSCVMAFDPSCDIVMAIGSGVLNDCCKVLAHCANLRSMVVGTAPSMDGYASNSSSMIRERIKVSLYGACPAAIIADTDIIKNAPMRMLWAGLGDMLAKYISICEWRISHIVTGEYYCENIANLMRASLKKIVSAAPGLKDRDEKAVEATLEGLVLSGIAMSFAQISRPASGLEHYFSHLWEMMALDRGTPYELHGIQVGVGTYLTLRLYDVIRKLTPNRQKAEAFMRSFDPKEWEKEMRGIFGKAAQTVIDSEKTIFHKNDPARQKQHLDRIIAHWDDILRIIDEELPSTEAIGNLMRTLAMPMQPSDIGVTREDTEKAFIGSRDIRDKYLSSSMLWDMGVLHEIELPQEDKE